MIKLICLIETLSYTSIIFYIILCTCVNRSINFQYFDGNSDLLLIILYTPYNNGITLTSLLLFSNPNILFICMQLVLSQSLHKERRQATAVKFEFLPIHSQDSHTDSHTLLFYLRAPKLFIISLNIHHNNPVFFWHFFPLYINHSMICWTHMLTYVRTYVCMYVSFLFIYMIVCSICQSIYIWLCMTLSDTHARPP